MVKHKQTTKHYKNGKKRNRKLRRKLSKKRLLSDKQTRPIAGDIAKYIDWFSDVEEELRRENYWFQPVARVSFRHQEKNGYLDSQVGRLKEFFEMADLSDRMYPVERITCSAFDSKSHNAPPGYAKPHYPALERIAFNTKQKEKLLQVKIALLFESVDRAIRPDNYRYDRDAPLKEDELPEFAEITQNLRIVVICSPSCLSPDVAEYRTIYNRFCEDNKYPGWKTDRRNLLLPIVLELKSKGHTLGEIVKMTGISKTTIVDWCK